MKFEHIDKNTAEKLYNNYLDEVYGEVFVAGLSYNTSYILELVDETAYRIGFTEWLDSEGWVESASGYSRGGGANE